MSRVHAIETIALVMEPCPVSLALTNLLDEFIMKRHLSQESDQGDAAVGEGVGEDADNGREGAESKGTKSKSKVYGAIDGRFIEAILVVSRCCFE